MILFWRCLSRSVWSGIHGGAIRRFYISSQDIHPSLLWQLSSIVRPIYVYLCSWKLTRPLDQLAVDAPVSRCAITWPAAMCKYNLCPTWTLWSLEPTCFTSTRVLFDGNGFCRMWVFIGKLSCSDINCTRSNPRYQNLGNLEQKLESWDRIHHSDGGECIHSNRLDDSVCEINATYVITCLSARAFCYTAFIDAPPPYPGYKGCFITAVERILWVPYLTLTIVEAGVFFFLSMLCLRNWLKIVVLSLLVISGIRACMSLSAVIIFCSLSFHLSFRQIWLS